ncbi:hypothetical protein QJS10_CPB18g01770 [Acorus calamus]|uniref:Uncharacterized protein n=1 Tax=Acorus calamus TaxID=4465 RepID=A0AAV9CPM7_ACOCL|nr:hypothetical protein QJS10_CPB18g01770 [Acorus calamus]
MQIIQHQADKRQPCCLRFNDLKFVGDIYPYHNLLQGESIRTYQFMDGCY